MQILFSDDNIMVCVKEQGVLSEKSDSQPNVPALILAQTGREVFPVHRLDRETSGVMVYALNARSASVLSSEITNGEMKKRYYAVVRGELPEGHGVMEDFLFRDKAKNKSYVVKRERKGVRRASLEYTRLAFSEGLSLAEILLHTGRTHQIRVQFSSRGFPLYGDGRYGGGEGKLALFAYSLGFIHPVTKEKMVFSALPDSGACPWALFDNILSGD